jgi:hypothetical protein
MKRAIPIATLFLDSGGVLLTDEWDHHARIRAGRSSSRSGLRWRIDIN